MSDYPRVLNTPKILAQNDCIQNVQTLKISFRVFFTRADLYTDIFVHRRAATEIS